MTQFQDTFRTLRAILVRHGGSLQAQTDKPGDYGLVSPTKTDRAGRPLYIAGVQIKKRYVSYHLMAVYAIPELVKRMSPALKKRMQGKSCFNFTTIHPEQARELSALTKAGIQAFKKIKLPWE